MVTFQNVTPGETLAPGSRIRTVWLLTGVGQLAAAVNPFADQTDQLTQGAAQIAEGLTSRQLGYATNVPPAIAPGDLGVVVDIRLSSAGPAKTAAQLASFLDDLPGFGTVRLDSLGPITPGESASQALKRRQDATNTANAQAADALPTGVLSGAADSVGQGVRTTVNVIKWLAVAVVLGIGVYAWRTYGRSR